MEVVSERSPAIGAFPVLTGIKFADVLEGMLALSISYASACIASVLNTGFFVGLVILSASCTQTVQMSLTELTSTIWMFLAPTTDTINSLFAMIVGVFPLLGPLPIIVTLVVLFTFLAAALLTARVKTTDMPMKVLGGCWVSGIALGTNLRGDVHSASLSPRLKLAAGRLRVTAFRGVPLDCLLAV